MKRTILMYSILLQLILTGCVGKEFITKPEQKQSINVSVNDGGGGSTYSSGTGNAIRGEDYLQCCILEYSCMMELEANRSSTSNGVSGGSTGNSPNRIPFIE